MAVERIQASPLIEDWGGSPGATITFGSSLTAGNDVWAHVMFFAADGPLDAVALIVDGGSPVGGTLVSSEDYNMAGDVFTYAFYVWRDVPAGTGVVRVTRSTTVIIAAIETSPDAELESAFSGSGDEGDFPVTTLQAGNLAFAGLRIDSGSGVTGANGSLVQGADGSWNYAISAEFAGASGNALEWTQSSGTYRGIVGIVIAEAGGAGPVLPLFAHHLRQQGIQ